MGKSFFDDMVNFVHSMGRSKHLPSDHPMKTRDDLLRSKNWLKRFVREFFAWKIGHDIVAGYDKSEMFDRRHEIFRVLDPIAKEWTHKTSPIDSLYLYLLEKHGEIQLIKNHAKQIFWSASEHARVDVMVDVFLHFVSGEWSSRVFHAFLCSMMIVEDLPVHIEFREKRATSTMSGGGDPSKSSHTDEPVSYMAEMMIPGILKILFGEEIRYMNLEENIMADVRRRGSMFDPSDSRWSIRRDLSKEYPLDYLRIGDVMQASSGKMNVVKKVDFLFELCLNYDDRICRIPGIRSLYRKSSKQNLTATSGNVITTAHRAMGVEKFLSRQDAVVRHREGSASPSSLRQRSPLSSPTSFIDEGFHR
eukprot:TRINITY_DN3399_c0_g1_i1.p1 TRINITY_DN3399_c0_g1~~TRINITY_DN3399_c0_g1_i1.p1  ORF type:complete len:362 (-),score=94.54 TRINITY_DN3399_c0_g1_i1:96-1181(-)